MAPEHKAMVTVDAVRAIAAAFGRCLVAPIDGYDSICDLPATVVLKEAGQAGGLKELLSFVDLLNPGAISVGTRLPDGSTTFAVDAGRPEVSANVVFRANLPILRLGSLRSEYPFDVVLALDIDGIFHPEGCSPDLEWVHLEKFEQAIRQSPRTAIVISSARRAGSSIAEMRSHFSPDIAARIVGLTPDLYTPGAQYTRGLRELEIWAWMNSRAPRVPWLALDDRKGLFNEGSRNLLLVPHSDDGGIGLQFEHLEELVERLNTLASSVAEDAPLPSPQPMTTKKSYVIIIAVSLDGQSFVQLTKNKDPEHLRSTPGASLVGKRTFPGGGIEVFDSTPLHAAKREAFEEFGLDLPVSSFEQIGSNSLPGRDLHYVFVAADIQGAKAMESEAISVERIDEALAAARGDRASEYVSDFGEMLEMAWPRIQNLRDQNSPPTSTTTRRAAFRK